jgi:hypothetical protein
VPSRHKGRGHDTCIIAVSMFYAFSISDPMIYPEVDSAIQTAKNEGTERGLSGPSRISGDSTVNLCGSGGHEFFINRTQPIGRDDSSVSPALVSSPKRQVHSATGRVASNRLLSKTAALLRARGAFAPASNAFSGQAFWIDLASARISASGSSARQER